MLGDVYVNELDGALPVSFKLGIYLCPPDCGGADFDEYYYSPHCPNCDHDFKNSISRTPFCPYCGQKLWWHVKYPRILDSEE